MICVEIAKIFSKRFMVQALLGPQIREFEACLLKPLYVNLPCTTK